MKRYYPAVNVVRKFFVHDMFITCTVIFDLPLRQIFQRNVVRNFEILFKRNIIL
jgi:hypothetical protein